MLWRRHYVHVERGEGVRSLTDPWSHEPRWPAGRLCPWRLATGYSLAPQRTRPPPGGYL